MERIEKIIEMIQNNGADSFLQHALALEYIKISKDDEALHQFTELLTREPDYIGSYYHLGKLHERNGRITEAIAVYENGMIIAKKLNDNHSFSELRGAYEELAL